MKLFALQKADNSIIFIRAEDSADVYNAFRGIGFKKNPEGIKAIFTVKPNCPKAKALTKTDNRSTVFNSHQYVFVED